MGREDPEECSDLLGLLGFVKDRGAPLASPGKLIKSNMLGGFLPLRAFSRDRGVMTFMPPPVKWMSLLWLLRAPAVTGVLGGLGTDEPRGVVALLVPRGVDALLGGSSLNTKLNKASRS